MSTKPTEAKADAAWKWWSSLQPHEFNGRRTPGDRAAIARLKRASSLLEALDEPATFDLFHKLGFSRDTDLGRAALVAAVLAHVREDRRSERVAASIGDPRGGAESTPLITPLRFKRLMSAREPDDLLIAFRRVIAILGRTANVKDLAHVLLAFTDPDERRADIARTRFAFDYHGAGQFAPDAEPASPANPAST